MHDPQAILILGPLLFVCVYTSLESQEHSLKMTATCIIDTRCGVDDHFSAVLDQYYCENIFLDQPITRLFINSLA